MNHGHLLYLCVWALTLWVVRDGTEPIVILDDVFAELDRNRRRKLVDLLEDAEQVLITAAVGEDIPEELRAKASIFDVVAEIDEHGDRVSTLSSHVNSHDRPNTPTAESTTYNVTDEGDDNAAVGITTEHNVGRIEENE